MSVFVWVRGCVCVLVSVSGCTCGLVAVCEIH